MSGGNFALDGGFWSVIAAVQTSNAPTLHIVLTLPTLSSSPGRCLRPVSPFSKTPTSEVLTACQ